MRRLLVWIPLAACGGGGLTPGPYPDGTPAGLATGAPAGVATGVGAGTPSITGTGTGASTGTGTGGATGTGTGSGSGWSHTATVDGSSAEYGPDEQFAIDGGSAWITWDADALYVAVQHPDVSTGGPQHWLLIYLGDGASGTTTGVGFNTQIPTLALPAATLVRWKTDDSWNSQVTWTGVSWQDSPYWLGTGGSSHAEDPVAGIVEFRLPFTALGLTDPLLVHVSFVYEGAGYETSFSPTPDTSFVSGTYDPSYDHVWLFDRSRPDPPASYAPVP